MFLKMELILYFLTIMSHIFCGVTQGCPPMELSFLLDQSENARYAASTTDLLANFDILDEQLNFIINNIVLYNSANISIGAYGYSGAESIEIIPYWSPPTNITNTLEKLRSISSSGSWTSSGLRNIVTGPRYNDSLLFLITSQGSSYTTRRTQAIAEANRVKSLGWRIIVIALQSRNALDDIELSSIDPDYQNNIISGQDKNYYGLADKVNDIINQKCTMSTTSSTSAQTTTVSETTTEALWTTARSSSTATMTTAFMATDSTTATLTTAFTATDSTTATLTTAFTATDSTTATTAPLMDNRTATTDPACPPIELTFLLDQSQPACDAASSRFKYDTNNRTKFNILEDQLKIVLDYLAVYNSTDTRVGAYTYSGKQSLEILPAWTLPVKAGQHLWKLRLLPNAGSWTYFGLRNIKTRPKHQNNVVFLVTAQGSRHPVKRYQAIAEANRVKDLGWDIRVLVLKSSSPYDVAELWGIDPHYIVVSDKPNSYTGLSREIIHVLKSLCHEKKPRNCQNHEKQTRDHRYHGDSSEENDL